MGSIHDVMPDILDRLTAYQEETLTLVKLRRARTIFNRKVFKRAADEIVFHIETGPSSKVKRKVHEVLEKWANGKPFFLVVSERLPMHLNLPVRTYPEDCYILQVLFLGEGLPPALLTLYAQDSVDEIHTKTKEGLTLEMREFCMRCARMLTLSLLNFCHREFLLLPCTIRLDGDFTAEKLQREIDDQLDDAREYYGGPEELGKVTYDELVRAVTIAATTTNVPCFLCGGTDQKKEWLLAMDRDWDRSMRHVLNEMLDDSQVAVTYTKKTETKTKSAVLEAAKRISYSCKVVVVTTDADVQQTVKCVSQAAQEEHGLDPDWFRSVVPAESVPEADCDCVVAVDVKDVSQLHLHNLKMVVSLQRTKPERKEKVRVLLIGRSGSGKSSTANTLLGKDLCESSVSFSQVTTTSQIRRRTHQGREIEVVDSPGIRDINSDRGIDGECLTGSSLGRGFDVVCYVIRIGHRFTEEEERVFKRLTNVLGSNVLMHMIIVFTCGDEINEGDDIGSNLKQAPKGLTQIVETCQQRYVVFDNTKPQNKAQLEEFFAMVKTMKESVNEEVFYCPSAADIENNWKNASSADMNAGFIRLNERRREGHFR